MARTVTAVCITILSERDGGHSTLHRLHTWLVEHTSVSAVALSDAAATIRAACHLKRPARLTRVKQEVRQAACDADDVVHVEGVADALAACARVIDGAGGMCFAPPTPTEAITQTLAAGRMAGASRPHTLLLHSLSVGNVTAGRHAAWAAQRAAGVLRPLPLSRALGHVMPHLDAACMLPVHHACEGPDALAARFAWPARLANVQRQDLEYIPTPSCPLCWRNNNLREALGPGHVRATIPALYAAGYDAGHLLLRHAEHGLAHAATVLVRETREPSPSRERDVTLHRTREPSPSSNRKRARRE